MTEISFKWSLNFVQSHARYRNASCPLPSQMRDTFAIIGHPPLSTVDLQVFGEVVGTWEPLLARRALIGFDARMRSSMSRKFVRSWKPPLTSSPRADKRFLSRMSAEMSFQMWRLSVYLFAPVECTAKSFVFNVEFCGTYWFLRRDWRHCVLYVDWKRHRVEYRGNRTCCWRRRWTNWKWCIVWFRGCYWRQNWRQAVGGRSHSLNWHIGSWVRI
jgi:hypothetical protein